MSKNRDLLVRLHHDASLALVSLEPPSEITDGSLTRLLDELEATIGWLCDDDGITGVVLAPGRFAFASADLYAASLGAPELSSVARRMQRIFVRIEHMPKPVVAAIAGACLGTAFELALACHARVASDCRETRLGHPAIELGVVPAAGGTVRLPRLVGLTPALDMLLHGRTIRSQDALAIGLVDEVVPASILERVAVQHLMRLRASPRSEKRSGPRWAGVVPPRVAIALARRRARARRTEHDLAPDRLLDVLEIGLRDGADAGMAAEADAFGRLAASATARARVGVQSLPRTVRDATPQGGRARAIGRVAIVGAGAMGSELAYVAAATGGLPVRLRDRDHTAMSTACHAIDRWFTKAVHDDRIAEHEAQRRRSSITTTLSASGLARCEVVIEAVRENPDLKRAVLASIEADTPPDTVIASCTSAIPMQQLAQACRRPHNLVGMHFFLPARKMALCEIVASTHVAPDAIATAVALARRMGKVPIVVGDGPGFYTTRILAAYLAEAYRLLCEGAGGDRIDAALVHLGFPLGPFALVDTIGMQVAADVEHHLGEVLFRRVHYPRLASALLADGREGRRGGRGFYVYGQRPRFDENIYSLLRIEDEGTRPSASEIVWRCMLQMINEAMRCLDEGIVTSPHDGDAAAVLGLGFPAHLGGPFHLVARHGAAFITEQLCRHRDEHGERFEPSRRLLA